jgi:3-deoxy-D-manno-octulosonate 8-phosphate phosphatase (KDO 8-P phosphatase)
MTHSIPKIVARRIRFVMFDVDGVLTDNGVYLGVAEDGTAVELKRFDIMDGIGLKLLAAAGLHIVLVTGRASAATRRRAEELGLPYHEAEGARKLPLVERLMAEQGVGWDEVACLCDDLADLPVMRRAALPVAVANASAEVRALAGWQTRRGGGSGAAREFAEALLGARGEWAAQVARYWGERDSDAADGGGSARDD